MISCQHNNEMEIEAKKPFKVKDITRTIRKAIMAGSLEEMHAKVAEKFERFDENPTIHLDSDGTEIDDEEYFRTLEPNAELIVVFPGEHWIDPCHCVTITTPHDQIDAADRAEKAARIKQLVGQLQTNLCNVTVMSDPELDSLTDMDPNSLVDITGKDFMEHLKDSGRPSCAKRNAEDRINLLKLLKEGAIFCSESFPDDAEDIDAPETRPQPKDEIYNHNNRHQQTNYTRTIEQVQVHNTGIKQHQDQNIKFAVNDNNLQYDNHSMTPATRTRAGNTKTPDI